MKRSRSANRTTPRFTKLRERWRTDFNRAVQLGVDGQVPQAQDILRRLRATALRAGDRESALVYLETQYTILLSVQAPHEERIALLRRLFRESGDATARWAHDLGHSLRALGRLQEAAEMYSLASRSKADDAKMYARYAERALSALRGETR